MESRPWILGFVLIPLGVAKYGLDIWPGWNSLRDASLYMPDPTLAPSLMPPQDYILGSPGLIVLSWVTGLNGPWQFFTLSLFLTIVALVLPFFMQPFRRDFVSASILFIFIAGGSLLPFLLTWIGIYDSLTIIGATLGVLSRNTGLAIFGWVMVGFNHWQIGVVMLVAAAPFLVSDSGIAKRITRYSRLLIASGSLVVGFILNWTLLNYWGDITSRSEIVEQYGIVYYLNGLVAVLPVVVFSSLGIGWLLVLRRSSLRQPLAIWIIGSSVLVSILLPMIALDQSRTIALCLTPAIFLFVSKYRELYGLKESQSAVRWYFLAAVIVPIPLALAGAIDHNSWQSILSLRGHILGI